MRALMKTFTAMALCMPMAAVAEDVRVLSIETNREGEKEYIARIEAAFEAANPGVDVIVEYMEDEAFKVKLPTLLQSPNKPDLFFSWSGGLVAEQASQGVLRDIGPCVIVVLLTPLYCFTLGAISCAKSPSVLIIT